MPTRPLPHQPFPGGFSEFSPPPLPPVPSTPTIATATTNRQFTAGVSGAAGLLPSSRRGTPAAAAATTQDQPPDVRYTVYLRLPFPRNGFVDPPPVDWDASKERSLWKVISRQRNTSSELDWNMLAEHFNVSAPFLLQQVAWLYERELSQVRAQLRRVGTAGASTPLNAPGTPQPVQRSLAGQEPSRPSSAVPGRPLGTPMSRTSSRSLAHPSVSPSSKEKATASNTSATPMSRTASTATTRAPPLQTSQYFPANPTLQNLDLLPQTSRTPRPVNTNVSATSPTALRRSASSSSSSSSKTSDGESSVEPGGLLQTRRHYRTKFGASSRIARASKDETDEDESPAFLPWAEGTGDGTGSPAPMEDASMVQNTFQTGRRNPRGNAGGYEPNRRENASGGTVRRGLQQINIQPYSGVSDSGASTPASQSSPRRRVPGENRRGNESSPSMGSSFSDLSDFY